MSIETDKEELLDALYSLFIVSGGRPSVNDAKQKYMPDWDHNRMLAATEALVDDGDVLNPTTIAMHVDISSLAQRRAQSRIPSANAPGNTTNYNIGSMHNSPLQHVAEGGYGTQSTNYDIKSHNLREIVDVYRRNVDDLQLDPESRRKADKAIATIEAQTSDEEPDQTIVRAAGRSLKTIIEGAIGGTIGNIASNPGVWAGLLALFS